MNIKYGVFEDLTFTEASISDLVDSGYLIFIESKSEFHSIEQ